MSAATLWSPYHLIPALFLLSLSLGWLTRRQKWAAGAAFALLSVAAFTLARQHDYPFARLWTHAIWCILVAGPVAVAWMIGSSVANDAVPATSRSYLAMGTFLVLVLVVGGIGTICLPVVIVYARFLPRPEPAIMACVAAAGLWLLAMREAYAWRLNSYATARQWTTIVLVGGPLAALALWAVSSPAVLAQDPSAERLTAPEQL